MSPDRLPIALIGCGHWGRHVLRDLVASGAEVSVVARSSESRANAERGGAARIVARIADLPPPSGVVVATPVLTHLDVTDEALSRWPDAPIYSQKVLDPRPAAIRERLPRYAGRVFVMHIWRYHPGIVALGDIARSGELGPAQGLRIVREQWGHVLRDVDDVWTLIPHDLSIMREVLGDVPPARAACFETIEQGRAGISGLLGDAPWVNVHTSVLGFGYRREFTLHCRDGIARLNDAYADAIEIIRPTHLRLGDAPAIERRPVSTRMPLLLQIEAFLTYVRGGGPPPRSGVEEELTMVERICELRRLAGE